MERFRSTQRGRTFHHPKLPQTDEGTKCVPNESHSFVVAADTQIGLLDRNQLRDGDEYAELRHCRKAIEAINKLHPRPLFCCVCGDLVDMTAGLYANNPKPSLANAREHLDDLWTEEECNDVQDEQFRLFQDTWNLLHPDIAVVCVCGNHDVGNRPNAASIERYRSAFGDEFFAFWVKGCYNIVLNSSLISQPEEAMQLYDCQLDWLKEQLAYAKSKEAGSIFVFLHHPLFLYDEDEDRSELKGTLVHHWPPGYEDRFDPNDKFPESYFPLPRERRRPMLDMFAKYKVTACFAGHFHQNLVRRTSFGMEMITTGPLSLVSESSGNEGSEKEPFALGFRIVHVVTDTKGKQSYSHRFLKI